MDEREKLTWFAEAFDRFVRASNNDLAGKYFYEDERRASRLGGIISPFEGEI